MSITPGKLPSYNALKAFEAAARHKSFVGAAHELCVSPAAISHQIKGLEAHLGTALFERHGRRVALSVSGRQLLPELQQGFAMIEKATMEMVAHHGRHLLTVTTNPAFAAKWLLPRIHLFSAMHPDVDIRLEASSSIQSLPRDRIDAAIRFGSGHFPGLVARPLLVPNREVLFPVCSPSLLGALHTPEDLGKHTLLHDDTLSAQSLVPDWQAWLASQGLAHIDAKRGLRFSNSLMAIEAAINGQGVALGCSYVVADDLAAGRLVKPFDLTYKLDSGYFFVHSPNPAKKVNQFYAWVMGFYRDTDPAEAQPT